MFFLVTTAIFAFLYCYTSIYGRRRLAKEIQEAFNRGAKYGYDVATEQRFQEAWRKHRDEN